MNIKNILFLFVAITLNFSAAAQQFKYAFVSDTHIGAATGIEDLKRTVADINQQNDLDFVIVTGDITEMGTNDELKLAKAIFAQLRIPFYIIPGNHDTGWSESGGVSFIKEFGNDKFTFDHKGYRFIGCASGPYVRMSDGHVPRDATVWLSNLLKKTPKKMPVIFANHYPLDNGLDNWYEVINLLKTRNIQYAIAGHWHNNKSIDFEGIPGTVGRSNLRAKDSIGGYNIVTMRKDTAYFAIKYPQQAALAAWQKISLKNFAPDAKLHERPTYQVNLQYPQIKQVWTYHSNANVVNTPAQNGKIVVFGNSLGSVEALDLHTGRKKWTFQTKGAIYSSPAFAGNAVILGSGDGNIYAINTTTGKMKWKVQAKNAVLGSAIVHQNLVFIGASDNTFSAIDTETGDVKWTFNEVEGAVVGTPLIYQSKIIFGSWGRHLYALDIQTGSLAWKWNNGQANRMFSPAMCTPVASKGVVYIAAPDRFLTAIDVTSGQTLWRNKEAGVRESIGLSADSNIIYGKTMQDEIVGVQAKATNTGVAWRLNAGFGYEHTPSMLIEKDGKVFYGTKNGTVYAFDPKNLQNLWAHKIDNSMVNTVNPIDGNHILVSTMDGKVTLLEELNVR